MNCEMIWKIWKKGKFSIEKISTIWRKPKLNSEKIWKIQKKGKLNCEKVWKIQKKIAYSHDHYRRRRGQREIRRSSSSNSVENPPKTRK
jgi:hypothetical protein